MEPALSAAKGRHLTVTGFVVHEGRIALHWHRKLGAWLPAGGHIEPGEDPVQAVLREVREEFDLEAEVLPLAPRVHYEGGPAQLEPPYTVLVCPIEPGHEHIDLVYFLRLESGFPGRSHDPDNPIHWVDEATLRSQEGLPLAGACGPEMPFAPDVRALALEAIRLTRQYESARSAPPSPPTERAQGDELPAPPSPSTERGPGGEVSASASPRTERAQGDELPASPPLRPAERGPGGEVC